MASLKAGSTLASSPTAGDNSTKIATTAFVEGVKLKNSTIPVGVSVGPTGTFTTLRKAIDYMCATYSDNRPAGFKAYIQLDSDFVLNEHIVLTNVDLGWLTITSDGIAIVATMQNISTPVPKTIWAEGVEYGTYNVNTPTTDLFSEYPVGYGACFVFIGCTAPTFWNVCFEANATWSGVSKYLFLSINSKVKFYNLNTIGITSEAMGLIFSSSSEIYIRKCSIDSKGSGGIASWSGSLSIDNSTINAKVKTTGTSVIVMSTICFVNCATKYVGFEFVNSRVFLATTTIYENANMCIYAYSGSTVNLTSVAVYTVVGGTTAYFITAEAAKVCAITEVVFNCTARTIQNNYVGGAIIYSRRGSTVYMATITIVGTEPIFTNGATFYRVESFSTIVLGSAETRTTNIAINTVTANGVITK